VSPFEDPDGEFLVLVDDEGKGSPWPSFAEVPESREASPACIEENRTDPWLKSLTAATGG
jgi:MbtH protein